MLHGWLRKFTADGSLQFATGDPVIPPHLDIGTLGLCFLLFRQREGGTEVLLIKPGGPFWRKKDSGAWMIPKGMIEPGEVAAETTTGTIGRRHRRSAGEHRSSRGGKHVG